MNVPIGIPSGWEYLAASLLGVKWASLRDRIAQLQHSVNYGVSASYRCARAEYSDWLIVEGE